MKVGLKCCLVMLGVTVVMATAQAAQAATAKAWIHATDEDSKLSGIVHLEETDQGLEMTATFENAPPGMHGFHIHEFGSCAESGKAAGGHYNPDGVQHGFLPEHGFGAAHGGDMGNVLIDLQGKGSLSLTVPGLKLLGLNHAVAGRAFILHQKEDDFGQPTGNAGARIGCGTIVITS